MNSSSTPEQPNNPSGEDHGAGAAQPPTPPETTPAQADQPMPEQPAQAQHTQQYTQDWPQQQQQQQQHTQDWPQQHAPGAAPAPAAHPGQPGQPSNFMAALSDQLSVLMNLGKGKPVEALHIATHSRLFWAVSLGAIALIGGLFFATYTGRLGGAALTAGASPFGYSSYFTMSFGAWFGTFLMVAIMTAIALTLRATALHLTFKAMRASQPFTTSMATIATAYSLLLPVFIAMFVLILIPGGVWMTLLSVVLMLVAALIYLVAELTMYIGLNRTANLPRSPMRPHVIATGIWMVAMAVIYFIVMLIAFESLANQLTMGGLL